VVELELSQLFLILLNGPKLNCNFCGIILEMEVACFVVVMDLRREDLTVGGVDKKKAGLWGSLRSLLSRWSSLVIWAERRFPSGMTNKRGKQRLNKWQEATVK
jgi:hypothetical protein